MASNPAPEGRTTGRTLRRAQAAFCAVALAMLALPFVGMLWASTDATTENRTLAPLPSLVEEDGVNKDFLSDLGSYFDDHFAYRNELVTADALVRTPLLNSPTDQVVVGTDGWLYYGGTLNDYLGTGTGSPRANRNVAYNLSLVQGYVESYGSEFLFTLAPNKNSLYDENMPFFYLPGSVKNVDLLRPLLEEYGVNYVDLFEAFEAQGETLYCLRDSHWTNKGAALAADVLLGETEAGSQGFFERDAVVRDDYLGDLESMLYPSLSRTEENWYYEGVDDGDGWSGTTWDYVAGSSVEDAWVETEGQGDESLLVYRDSFGNALLPFLASAGGTSYFTKYVPYEVQELARTGADVVVMERAERHALDLATDPPIMPAPSVRAPAGASAGGGGFAALHEESGFVVVEGFVPDGAVSEDARFFVQVVPAEGEATTYVAFDASVSAEDAAALSAGAVQEASDYGWRAYLDPGLLPSTGTVRVLCVEDDGMTEVAACDVAS